ncbi:DUF6497 family protein [Roseovarius autotrophicus]|uniref:DUF6497 family protein n=1 Tax=Roseovarius autotrophicus TaxID=2824121 RepID=UPI0019F056B5|nr:DUF6497 family protein [Roseovarius autotrophicus]MBE0454509.1 hypothetical protein [Roseovarius sp.]
MRGAALVPALVLGLAAAAQEEALRLPSGLAARLFEVLTDRPEGGGLIYRFRYVAAGFDAGPEQLEWLDADLSWLCENHVLPRISNIGPQPGLVVISLADREADFGVYDPDVTQVFEAYRPKGGACMQEMF